VDLATVDRLLTTTRTVRRRLDLQRPVESDVIERCIVKPAARRPVRAVTHWEQWVSAG
jgi:hypothetical protein